MFKKTVYPYVYLYDSNVAGPKTAIIGGMHGDEKCGVENFYWMLNNFLDDFSVKFGAIYIILGNYKAVEIGKRYLEEDLNRQFGLKDVERLSFEKQRVYEIERILDKCDYVLDIHSTSLPSVPMTCSNGKPQDLEVCKNLGVEFITSGWGGKCIGKASDEYLEDGVGITLECGSHNDSNAFEFAKETTLKFLGHLKMIDYDIGDSGKVSKHIEIVEAIYPKTNKFYFNLEKIESFVDLEKDKVYAFDSDKKYIAEENMVLLMPKKDIKAGVEAGYLGRYLDTFDNNFARRTTNLSQRLR